MSARNEAILRMWSSEDKPTATEIGAEFGISRCAVLGAVFRARESGDPRACMRVPKRSQHAKVLRPFRVSLDANSDEGAAFLSAAKLRKVSPASVMMQALSILVRDNILDAVLDDGARS